MRLFTCLLFLAAPYFLFAQWQNMNGPYAGGALSYAGNTTYIFAANINGVYRSADLGDTWEDTGKGLSKDHDYFNVQANGADVLISGREASAFNIVAFLSRDNGDTWTKIPLPFYDAIFYYGITLAGGKLFAADGNHVWERPLDAGGVWTLNALDADPNAFYNIVVQDGRLFAFGYKEVAVCPDLAGQTWTKMPVNGLTHVVTHIQAYGDTIFVEDYDNRCYRTLNGGATWKRMRIYDTDLREVIRLNDTYFALHNYYVLYRSTDAGETWSAPAPQLPQLGGLETANGQLFGQYYLGGNYRITGDGTVFTRIGNGMAGGSINSFAQDDNQILLACGFNGLHRFDKKTQTWSENSIFPDILNLFATATDGVRMYAGLQYGLADSCLFRSDDGGQTWLNISPDFGFTFPQWTTSIQQILTTPKAVFIQEDYPDRRFWRSTDFGETWTQVPGGYVSKCLARDSTLFALRNSPFLQRSDDDGLSWQALDTVGIYPAGRINDFFLAGHRIFVLVETKGDYDQLFVSEDDGKTWRHAQPFAGAGSPIFSLAGTGDLAVGMARRPTLSQDGGKTWMPFATNLPNIGGSTVGADSNYIYVVVYDRGLWRLPLTELDFKTVSGEVYYDINLNKKHDPGEPPAVGTIVAVQPAGIHAVTDADGRYAILLNLPAGAEQQVAAQAPAPFNSVFPANVTVNNSLTSADFGIRTLPFGVDMGVYASLLTPINQGRDFQLLLTVRNEGGLPAGGRVYFSPDLKAVDYQTEPAATGSAGDSLYWDIPTLSPGKTFTARVTGHIPASAPFGLEYFFNAHLDPPPGDLLAVNNSATLVNRTYGLSRPVWKSVHREEIYWDEIQNGEKPVYMVSFRNPFPDTVRRVRVVDYLQTNLDPATLQILASSHPVQLRMQADGYTEFLFDDIALPDTITDPDALGYVVFSVGLRPGLPPETFVHNNVSVFFDDFSTPLGGGTVQVRILARPTTTIAEPSGDAQAGGLRIVPNPNTGAFRVQADGFVPGKSMVRVFNQTGLLCTQQTFDVGEMQVNLPPGIYWVQLTDHRKTAVGKMVVLR